MIEFEVTMVENLITHIWSRFTQDQVSLKNSLPLLLFSKMVRKNRVIQEMVRAMLYNKDVARNLWGEAINTACHTVNRVYFRPSTKKTPYEL